MENSIIYVPNSLVKYLDIHFSAYILGEDDIGTIVENEAELLGLSGYFTKDAAIVCGGVNGDGDKAKCFEWDSNLNQ